MTAPTLPHAYPFRFVDTVVLERNADFSEGTVSLRVSANGRAAMGESWGSPLLLAEAIAQSALLLEGGDADLGRRGFLAGLDGLDQAAAAVLQSDQAVPADPRVLRQLRPLQRGLSFWS